MDRFFLGTDMMEDLSYREALDWLYAAQMFGMKLGLAGISRLLTELGVDRPKSRVIHVAGTNGKGSVCAFAESVARTAGYSTGLFTSPHLVRFNERIRVNGADISDEDVARLIVRVRRHIQGWDTPPTFFELTLAVAMLYFAERQPDLIILETGMGGRLDATNALQKDAAVITPIGMDHTQYLGATLYEIAREKAAIIAWHCPALTAPQQPEAMRAIHEAAVACDTDCQVVSEPCELPLGLTGAHQKLNAALALEALRAAIPHYLCSDAQLAEGLAATRWPGRFEEVLPGVILDGAHNPPAMHTLVNTWRATHGDTRAHCVFAGAADKDLTEVLHILSPIVESWTLPPVQSPRIMSQEQLARLVREVSVAPVNQSATLAEALALPQRPLLICGSFFLIGETLALIQDSSDFRVTQQ